MHEKDDLERFILNSYRCPTYYISESTSTQMPVLPARERELLQLGSPLIQKLKEAITEAILQFHRQPEVLHIISET